MDNTVNAQKYPKSSIGTQIDAELRGTELTIMRVRMNACTWRDKVQNLNPILDVWKTWEQGKGVAGCNINLLKAWIWHENTISYQWECDTVRFFFENVIFTESALPMGGCRELYLDFHTAKTWLYFSPTPNFFKSLAKGF